MTNHHTTAKESHALLLHEPTSMQKLLDTWNALHAAGTSAEKGRLVDLLAGNYAAVLRDSSVPSYLLATRPFDLIRSVTGAPGPVDAFHGAKRAILDAVDRLPSASDLVQAADQYARELGTKIRYRADFNRQHALSDVIAHEWLRHGWDNLRTAQTAHAIISSITGGILYSASSLAQHTTHLYTDTERWRLADIYELPAASRMEALGRIVAEDTLNMAGIAQSRAFAKAIESGVGFVRDAGSRFMGIKAVPTELSGKSLENVSSPAAQLQSTRLPLLLPEKLPVTQEYLESKIDQSVLMAVPKENPQHESSPRTWQPEIYSTLLGEGIVPPPLKPVRDFSGWMQYHSHHGNSWIYYSIDPSRQTGIEAKYRQGQYSSTIYAQGDRQTYGSGTELFLSAVKKFIGNGDDIRTISENFDGHGRLTTNREQYEAHRLAGEDDATALRHTFSGRMAARLGLTEVRITSGALHPVFVHPDWGAGKQMNDYSLAYARALGRPQIEVTKRLLEGNGSMAGPLDSTLIDLIYGLPVDARRVVLEQLHARMNTDSAFLTNYITHVMEDTRER